MKSKPNITQQLNLIINWKCSSSQNKPLLFVFQLAASIGVGKIQTTGVNNRVDETNRRVGTSENDIIMSKADIKTLTDNSCTTTKCTAIETAATLLTTRVTDAETAATTTDTFVKNTCNKVFVNLDKKSPEVMHYGRRSMVLFDWKTGPQNLLHSSQHTQCGEFSSKTGNECEY